MEYIPRGWIADAHCILDQRPNVTFESRPRRPVILPIHLSRGGCLISRPGTKKGLAFDRQLPRPAQRGAAVFTRRREGGAVHRHLFRSQAAQYRAWQHPLNENVLLKNHFLAALAAEALENLACILGPVLPGHRLDDGLHVDDPFNPPGILASPIEAQGGAPVVYDKDHVVSEIQLVP